MKIAIIVNHTKPHALNIAKEISRFLQQKKVQVVGPDADKIDAMEPIETISPETIDFTVSLGGDGSILAMMHSYPNLNAPILGVNLGTLGFLADISPENIFSCLEHVLANEYTVQERLMLQGVKGDGTSFLAVNEMVVHRGPNHGLVDICLSVNGTYFNTFSADGVIVATPSGSTAYSLSAGGPILVPELEAIVITPICPHALSNRPIVLSQPESIEIQYLSEHLPVEVAFDGICRFNLHPKEKFTISKAHRRFRLVSVPGFDYFATLRSKLNWTGSLRN